MADDFDENETWHPTDCDCCGGTGYGRDRKGRLDSSKDCPKCHGTGRKS